MIPFVLAGWETPALSEEMIFVPTSAEVPTLNIKYHFWIGAIAQPKLREKRAPSKSATDPGSKGL